MKLLLDFFPLALFFAAYQYYGEIVPEPTIVLMAATVLQTAIHWFWQRELPKIQLFTLALVVGFGAMALSFNNDAFVRHKPTVLYLVLALVFIAANFIGKKPIMQRMLSDSMPLPDDVWRRLGFIFAGFFAASALANHLVASYFSNDIWVNFKLFGMFGATLVFLLGVGVYLHKHLPDEEAATAKPNDNDNGGQ